MLADDQEKNQSSRLTAGASCEDKRRIASLYHHSHLRKQRHAKVVLSICRCDVHRHATEESNAVEQSRRGTSVLAAGAVAYTPPRGGIHTFSTLRASDLLYCILTVLSRTSSECLQESAARQAGILVMSVMSNTRSPGSDCPKINITATVRRQSRASISTSFRDIEIVIFELPTSMILLG